MFDLNFWPSCLSLSTHTHTHTHTYIYIYIYIWHINHCRLFNAKYMRYIHNLLLYGCTTWTLTKGLEKKLDGNYTTMLRAVLNKSWRQQPKRHQLYGHLPPFTTTIQVRRTTHARHCWRSRDKLISDLLLWTPTYVRAKAGRPSRTYIQQLCEDMWDVALKNYPRRWTMGRRGERGPAISELAAQHDD